MRKWGAFEEGVVFACCRFKGGVEMGFDMVGTRERLGMMIYFLGKTGEGEEGGRDIRFFIKDVLGFWGLGLERIDDGLGRD